MLWLSQSRLCYDYYQCGCLKCPRLCASSALPFGFAVCLPGHEAKVQAKAGVAGPHPLPSQVLCIPCPEGSFSSGGQVTAVGSTLEPRCRPCSTGYTTNGIGQAACSGEWAHQQQQQQQQQLSSSDDGLEAAHAKLTALDCFLCTPAAGCPVPSRQENATRLHSNAAICLPQ
jgi:hypothetical protein